MMTKTDVELLRQTGETMRVDMPILRIDAHEIVLAAADEIERLRHIIDAMRALIGGLK